jgi:hypothetical protein
MGAHPEDESSADLIKVDGIVRLADTPPQVTLLGACRWPEMRRADLGDGRPEIECFEPTSEWS